MKTATGWKDYQIIATGGGQKLERWGDVLLLRPDPQAIWAPAFDFTTHKGLHAIYERSQSGGGAWQTLRKFPDEWTIIYPVPTHAALPPAHVPAPPHAPLKFLISPTGFKHTGLFPEQAVNWERIISLLPGAQSAPRQSGCNLLNLFGYTGGATVAAAVAGAHVTHVDASKGMTEVCKRNAALNNIPNDRIRYIVEDCAKFTDREIRRGKTYDAIIMDPPSFGRGANGEVWKIEEHLDTLVAACCRLLSDKPLFFLINSYTTGLQPTVLKNILQRNLEKTGAPAAKRAILDAYEIGLPTDEGITLPAGCSCFATFAPRENGNTATAKFTPRHCEERSDVAIPK